MMNLTGKRSFSRTDRVKHEMSFGIQKKMAWRIVRDCWGSFKKARRDPSELIKTADLQDVVRCFNKLSDSDFNKLISVLRGK